jgi:hypothetical protein
MKQYTTLVDALNDLRTRGYTHDFNLRETCLECPQANRALQPSEFRIVETYRFEGMSNPDDNAVLYAIESEDGLKGVLVNAYGVYADPLSADMVAKLGISEDDR